MKIEYKTQGTIDATDLVARDIKIGSKKTDLSISTCGLNSDQLRLDFSCGFHMVIDSRGISFRRRVTRPQHDHDDDEYLVVNKKTKDVKWAKDYIHETDYSILYMTFGERVVDY